jgi:hypothetical protein
MNPGRTQTLLAVAAVLGVAGWSSTVRADPPAASSDGQQTDAKKTGREAFEIGRAAYDRADYEAAAVAFEQSYASSHAPRLLFNIAQALRLAGKCQRALGFYQQYRETGTELPSDFADLESQAQRCAEQQAKAQPATGDAAEPSTVQTPPQSPPAARADRRRVVDAPVSTPKKAEWNWSRSVGVSCLAAAAASGTAGAVMALRAKAASDRTASLSGTGGVWDPHAQANEQAGKAAAAWAIGLFATAAVVGSIGGWLVLRPTEPTPAPVVVAASPDGLSIQLRQRF